MDEAKIPRIVGKPDGWTPQTEADHFIKCPKCGDWYDMRKLEEVCFHEFEEHGPTPKQ